MARKMFPNKTDLDSPRSKFNFGFHDATLTVEKGWKIRRIVENGECNPEQISESTQKFYAIGYRYGLEVMKFSSERPSTSSPAWLSYTSRLSVEEVNALYREIYECEVGGLEHCLNHRADDYIIERAKEYAANAMKA